jgi:putative phosphoesterase
MYARMAWQNLTRCLLGPAGGGCALKLAIVSDSHRNLDGLREAVKDILSTHKVDLFIHLGDDYDDAAVFDEFGCKYLRVPGVYSNYYADKSVPNRLLKRFNGWKFLLTHTEASHSNDLAVDVKPEGLAEKKQIDVVLYGHSHIPNLEVRDEILLVNPGHLKAEDKKGYPATYAIIDINDASISAMITSVGSGKTLEEIDFKKTEAG